MSIWRKSVSPELMNRCGHPAGMTTMSPVFTSRSSSPTVMILVRFVPFCRANLRCALRSLERINMEIKRVGSQPSGILLRWATAGQEGPASEKKWQVTRDECRANDLVTQWKLSEVDHTLRAKDHPIGLPAQFALIRCSRHPNRHVFVAQVSRSSRVPVPPGIRIHSVRR